MIKKVGLLLFTLFLISIMGAQTQHGITLTWTQGTGPGTVTANAVYRGTVSGGPYTQIFKSTTPITTYFDPMTTANQGTKACYVTTDFVGNIESVNSNETCQTFPVQDGPPTNLSSSSQ